jgi:hypothetical protein
MSQFRRAIALTENVRIETAITGITGTLGEGKSVESED